MKQAELFDILIFIADEVNEDGNHKDLVYQNGKEG